MQGAVGGHDKWEADREEFPKLQQRQTISRGIGSADPDGTGRRKSRNKHTKPTPGFMDRGMRPAKCSPTVGKGDRDVRSRVVPGALTGTLSPLAKCFNPERITHVSQEHMENTDMDLHRSLAMTSVDETEPPCLNNIATMGLADSIETEQPVAEADVAEPGGPAATGTGGPVERKKKMRPAADSTGASGSRNGRTEVPVTLKFGYRSENVMPASGLAETGTGSPVGIMKERSDVDGSAEIGMRTGTETGEPVVAGTTFTTVAEVYAPFSGRKSQEGADSGGLDLSGDSTMDRTDVIREVSNTDQELKLSECSLDCSLDSDSEEENEIMVGVVGSTAPWYLTGWTNDVEVEFMIDTGCQVTIVATSVIFTRRLSWGLSRVRSDLCRRTLPHWV